MKLLVDIIKTLPDYFKSIRDFMVFSIVVKKQLVKLAKEIKLVLDNFYVQSCDLPTLEMHEKLLKIIVHTEDMIDFRRVRVLERYNENLPYTTPSFMEKLNTLIGKDSYSIEEIQEEPMFILYIYNVTRSWLEEINRMLRAWLPIHVGFEIKRPIDVETYANQGVAGAISYSITYNLRCRE